MVTLTRLYPHELFFENDQFERLPETIKALLECTSEIICGRQEKFLRLRYSDDSFLMLEDLFEYFRSHRIPVGYIFTPEL